jgi:hypothetical protein
LSSYDAKLIKELSESEFVVGKEGAGNSDSYKTLV